MAMPRAPLDPYCRLQGKASYVKDDHADPALAALATYAKAHAVDVWVYRDGKIALTSEQYAKALNRGKSSDLAPLVFGGEGSTTAQAAAEALSTLHEQSAGLSEAIRVSQKIDAQGKNARINPTAPIDHPIDIAERARATAGPLTQTIDTFQRDLPSIEEASRDITGRRSLAGNEVLLPVENALRGFGRPGNYMADLIARRNELVERLEAHALNVAKTVRDQLTPDENARGFQRWVEHGEAASPEQAAKFAALFRQVNAIDEQFYTNLQRAGVEVSPRVGADVQNPTGRYWARRRDLSALGDRKLAESMIAEVQQRAAERTQGRVQLTPEQALDVIDQMGFGDISRDRQLSKLMDAAERRGATLDRADAERLMEYMTRGERISGHLERERQLHTEGYITDFTRAYTATWKRNAFRLADALTFGAKDEKIYQAMDDARFTPELGPRAEQFMQEVFDLETGRARPQFSQLGSELYGWQKAKLSLGLLANSTQGMNTAMWTGLKPFVKALRDAALSPREFTGASLSGERSTVATRSGALPVKLYSSDAPAGLANHVLQDTKEIGALRMMGIDGGGARDVLHTGLDILLTPFRWVENFNRSVAQRAGEYYWDQLVYQIERNGESALNRWQVGGRLKELGMQPERVLAAVRANDQQALVELRTLAGLRVSNKTQFQSNYQSMPLWANKSELGRFMYQYKNFALNQTKFMLENLNPKAAWERPEARARFARTVATVGFAYPAVGIALTQLRQNLMGPTLAGQQIADALDDPTFGNLLRAGAIGMVLAGGMGVLADVGMTAALGNDFSLKNFVIPPAFSTVTNGMAVMGSAARGIVNADPEELYKVQSGVLREFGGLGGAVDERLKRLQGRSEPPESLTGALGRAFTR